MPDGSTGGSPGVTKMTCARMAPEPSSSKPQRKGCGGLCESASGQLGGRAAIRDASANCEFAHGASDDGTPTVWTPDDQPERGGPLDGGSMKHTATDLLPAKRLVVRRSGATDAANELEVDCPMVRTEVLLQRCAFCEHGQGLLLDPSTNGLTLRCSFAESARAKPLRAATDDSQLQTG